MDNILLLILLFLIINRKKEREVLQTEEEDLNKIVVAKDTTVKLKENKFVLNIPHTQEKVRLMKKIGPYFPPEYIAPINKSIMITEKILGLYEAISFMGNPTINYIESSIPMVDNRERINYIMNTIKDEISKEEIKDMGLVLDIIFNMDKYKSMLAMLNTFISDPNSLNEPKKLINIIEPLMEGKSEEEKKKIKEMMKMMELVKTLDKK